MKVLVSACLLGMPCRYDGRGAASPAVIGLDYDWLPVCPEVAGGLPTPRPAAEIIQGQVMTEDGRNLTREYVRGAQAALDLVQRHNVTLAILKARSPSCGSGQIYDGTFSKTLIPGDGVTAAILKQAGVTVLSEEEIDGNLDRPSEGG